MSPCARPLRASTTSDSRSSNERAITVHHLSGHQDALSSEAYTILLVPRERGGRALAAHACAHSRGPHPRVTERKLSCYSRFCHAFKLCPPVFKPSRIQLPSQGPSLPPPPSSHALEKERSLRRGVLPPKIASHAHTRHRHSFPAPHPTPPPTPTTHHPLQHCRALQSLRGVFRTPAQAFVGLSKRGDGGGGGGGGGAAPPPAPVQ
jgi:hypothetical protein